MRYTLAWAFGAVLFVTGATAQTSYAADYSNYTAISGRISIVDVDYLGSTIGVGGAYDLGLTESWVMSLGIDYWNKSDKDFGVEVSVRDITLGGFAKFMFPNQSPTFRPYAGAGLAIHLLKAEVEDGSLLRNNNRYEDSETELGIDIGGGFLYASSPGFAFIGELKLRDVNDAAIDQLYLTFGGQKDL